MTVSLVSLVRALFEGRGSPWSLVRRAFKKPRSFAAGRDVVHALEEEFRNAPDMPRYPVPEAACEVAEFASFAKARAAFDLRWSDLADVIYWEEASLVRTEWNADLHFAVLRKCVMAAGGDLKLVAVFPTGQPAPAPKKKRRKTAP